MIGPIDFRDIALYNMSLTNFIKGGLTMKTDFYKYACLTALVLGSLFIGANVKTVSGQEKEPVHSFPGVSVFTTPAGRLGFFEQGTGKIYLYDDNLSDCVFVGQLTKLGESIQPAPAK